MRVFEEDDLARYRPQPPFYSHPYENWASYKRYRPAELLDAADAASLVQVGPADVNGNPTSIAHVGLCSHAVTYQCALRENTWLTALVDDDQDGDADSATSRTPLATGVVFAPQPIGGLFAGDMQVSVFGPRGHQIRVLGWNPTTQQFDIDRGVGVVDSSDLAMISLSPSISLNEQLVFQDVDSGFASVPYTASAPSPVITELSAYTVPSTGGGVFTISGKNFLPNPNVRFDDHVQTPINAQVIFSSSSLITVNLPNLGAEVISQREVRIKWNQLGGAPPIEARGWSVLFEGE